MLQNRIRVFSDEQRQKLHENTLLLLAKKGVVFQDDEAVATFRKHGAKVTGQTVFFTEEMVEKALALCPKSFELTAPAAERSVTVGKGLLIHPPGGELFLTAPNGRRRVPVLQDYADIQKIYQACENVDICGSKPLNPGDKPEAVKGLYLTMAAMRHCNKAILTPVEEMDHRQTDCLGLYPLLYGDDAIFEHKYVTWHPVCSVSPCCYPAHAVEGIRLFAALRQPIVLVSAPMSGITSPVQLYSTLVQALAEILAGLVYAQLLAAGVPVVPSASLTYGNLRYASWECAAPDTALLLAGMVQMFREQYHLPARAQTGVTSAKTVDYQSGLETMQSFLMTALSGVQLTSQSVGSLANLLMLSPAKTVLDDEMVSRVRYILNGIADGEENFALGDLLATSAGGDFMAAPSTLAHFREGWQPSVSDWRSFDAWSERGSKDVVAEAEAKVDAILAAAPPSLLDDAQEKEMAAYIRGIERRYNII